MIIAVAQAKRLVVNAFAAFFVTNAMQGWVGLKETRKRL